MDFIKKHQAALKRFGVILVASAAIFTTTRITLAYETITNASTAAFCFLIIVLLSAFAGDFVVSVTVSLAATLCFNYFYLPPTGTFFIADFADWISLAAFLLTALVISRLTSSAAENARTANLLDKTMARLKDFGACLMSVPDDGHTLTGIMEGAAQIFALEYCSIHVHTEGKWRHFTGTAATGLSREIAGRVEGLDDHQTNLVELVNENVLGVRYARINLGSTSAALLVVRGGPLPANALDAAAYMIGNRIMEVSRLGEKS